MGKSCTILFLGVIALVNTGVLAQHNPHFVGNRTTIVHLFEWRWNDIADECERFLGPAGYGGVQTVVGAVPASFLQVGDKVWDGRRVQIYGPPVQQCRSEDLINPIYIDAVVNHMTAVTGGSGRGTGGSYFDSTALTFEGVPYTSEDFNVHGECPSASGEIESYQDPKQMRNCRHGGLNDLNQARKNVRNRIYEFLNRLVSYGVAGFRFDAAKHMWPSDMKAILDRLDNLPTGQGFTAGARAFVYQEVIDFGEGSVHADEYYQNGRVTEFKVGPYLGDIFRRRNNQQLRYVRNWGEGWGFMPGSDALVFVDNHDNQRGHGTGEDTILTFRESRLYKMAQAFTLAWPYGLPRIMSSYYWDGQDSNSWVGPPSDANFNILPVTVNPDLTCGNGWICEHRWRPIYHMMQFRNVVKGTTVTNFWDNGKDQIAFSRGNRGFIAINNDNVPLTAKIQTSLPPGVYCDIITADVVDGRCTGRTVTVASDGTVNLNISNAEEDPVIAIRVDVSIQNGPENPQTFPNLCSILAPLRKINIEF